MTRWFFYTFAILISGAFSSCTVHHRLDLEEPCVEIPWDYYNLERSGTAYHGEWWKEYGVPELDALVDQALSQNLDLKQSWWRVAEACWEAKVVASQKFPEITTSPAVSHTRIKGNPIGFLGGFGGGGIPPMGLQDNFTSYLLANSLTYEIDLWRRIDSETRAACYELRATREDMEAAAWLLAGSVVDLWFAIQEQKTLLNVIDYQIDVSRTQLELIELRYAMGQSTSLDVYQQRLQLSETEQQRTPVETALRTAQNLMATLIGTPPGSHEYLVEDGLVDLPPFPDVGQPAELLCNRPDLRALHRRLQAADYLVAAAVADRFPKLTLAIDYDFESDDLADLFNNQISRILGALTLPVIDGGRRRAEVNRRQAIVCELVNAFGQGFLDALLDVEDSLVEEKQQLKLLEQIQQAYEISITNLEESNWHYINGNIDYLSVIAAIQAKQNLERRLVIEKKTLLTIRAKLYRSLGGPFITTWCN